MLKQSDIDRVNLRRQAACLKAMRTLDNQLQRVSLLLGDFMHNNDCMKGLKEVSVSKRDTLSRRLNTALGRIDTLHHYLRTMPSSQYDGKTYES